MEESLCLPGQAAANVRLRIQEKLACVLSNMLGTEVIENGLIGSDLPPAYDDLYEDPEELPTPEDLSEMLKEGTKDSHTKAENTPFVKDFLRGNIKRKVFELVTVAIYHVYSAMEEELDKHQDHPALAPLYFPAELRRKNALEQDLAFLLGSEWRQHSDTAPSQATQCYVERIHAIGRTEPALLVAHAYTRYLGDLSGGQVLKKVVQRVLKLPASGEGVEFFSFPQISSHAGFKQLYRSRLNATDLDKEMCERIVEEANRVFNLNIELFEEFEEIMKALPAEENVAGVPLHDGKGDVSKCPYYMGQGASSSSTICPLHSLEVLLRHPAVILVVAVAAVLASFSIIGFFR
uniref:heme oxygenase (biliverdin-producing) n=1 Tax=Eptatretus burgeri TaxID=7764 RepID=A0A8C4Q8V4_EPTBU